MAKKTIFFKSSAYCGFEKVPGRIPRSFFPHLPSVVIFLHRCFHNLSSLGNSLQHSLFLSQDNLPWNPLNFTPWDSPNLSELLSSKSLRSQGPICLFSEAIETAIATWGIFCKGYFIQLISQFPCRRHEITPKPSWLRRLWQWAAKTCWVITIGELICNANEQPAGKWTLMGKPLQS